VVLQGSGGLALRREQWKYIEPAKGQRKNANTNIETGNDPQPQLYDLSADLGEKNNLADRHPDKVRELQAQLDSIRQGGRTPRR
jgi:arylsulfatase A